MSNRFWFVQHLEVIELEYERDHPEFPGSAYYHQVATGKPAFLPKERLKPDELAARKILSAVLLRDRASHKKDLAEDEKDHYAYVCLFQVEKAIKKNDARLAELDQSCVNYQAIINALPRQLGDRFAVAAESTRRHKETRRVTREFHVRHPSGRRRKITWVEIGQGLVREPNGTIWCKHWPWVDIADYRRAMVEARSTRA